MESVNKLPYIVTDLDGTVVSGEDGRILNQTAIDIQAYQIASDYKLTFATGRGDIMCRELIDIMKIKNPIISYNGALIRDPLTWEVLEVKYIDDELAIKILESSLKKNLDIVAYDVNNIIVSSDSKRYKIWSNYNKKAIDDKYKIDFIIYNNVREMIDGLKAKKFKVVKLLIDAYEDTLIKDAEACFYEFESELNITWSGEGLLDAMALGINKAFGLERYCHIVGIEPNQVVFFGDNYNDLEIMKLSGKGIAVGNAVVPLKELAKKIIESVNENGIGKELMRIIKASH